MMDESTNKIRKKNSKDLFIYFVLSIFVVSYGCAKPPIKELRNAQLAIENARQAEAEIYAPTDFKSAEDYLDQANGMVSEKKYDDAKDFAIKAKDKARTARNKAIKNKMQVKAEAEQRISELRTAIRAAEVAGAEKYSQAALSSVKRILRSAKDDYKKEKYLSAKEKAESGIAQAYNLEASAKTAQEAAQEATTRMEEERRAEAERLQTLKDEEARREEARRRALNIRRHIVQRGECLWLISENPDIYGDPYQWPILYRANRSQINDPDLIYPGQNFVIPRNISERNIQKSIRYARYRGPWSLFDGK